MKKKIYNIVLGSTIFLIATLMAAFGASAQNVSTIAGTGFSGYSPDGTMATLAKVNTPAGIVVDGSGVVYFADMVNNAVRKIDLSGAIYTVAGTGADYPGDGAAATLASLVTITGLAIDASGNLYIADAGHHRIRKVTPSGIIYTVAGNGGGGYSGDGGPATAAQLNSPYDVAVASDGTLYIADRSNNKVRKVNPSGNISSIIGDLTAGSTGDGGPATAGRVNDPLGVAVDASGNVYIADYGNYKVRKINSAGIVSTYAGTGTPGFSGEGGPATAATINGVIGISTDPSGNLYLASDASTAGNRVRVVYPNGNIHTLAGNGVSAFTGDGGPGTSAQLYNVKDATGDGIGNVYISDAGNRRVRKISAVPIAVTGVSPVCVAATGTVTATPGGGVWSTSSASVVIGSATGIVVGSTAGTAIVSYIIGVSSSSTIVTVNALADAGTITGTNNVCEGATVTLSNTATGGTWSCSAANATVSASGVVTGVTAGAVTISYTASNGCGTVDATFPFTVNSCPTAGISTIANKNETLAIFPNPNTGSFTVTLPTTANAVEVTVIDMLGKTVATNTITHNMPRTATFTLNNVPTGNYIIKVTDGVKTFRDKLMMIK